MQRASRYYVQLLYLGLTRNIFCRDPRFVVFLSIDADGILILFQADYF